MYAQWLDDISGSQEAIRRLNHGFIQGGHKAALIGKLAEEFELYMVSKLPPEFAGKAYFKPLTTIQNAFDDVAKEFGLGERVLLVPYGGSTLVVNKHGN